MKVFCLRRLSLKDYLKSIEFLLHVWFNVADVLFNTIGIHFILELWQVRCEIFFFSLYYTHEYALIAIQRFYRLVYTQLKHFFLSSHKSVLRFVVILQELNPWKNEGNLFL